MHNCKAFQLFNEIHTRKKHNIFNRINMKNLFYLFFFFFVILLFIDFFFFKHFSYLKIIDNLIFALFLVNL